MSETQLFPLQVVSEGSLDEFISKETGRTRKLLDGKLTEAKKQELQEKLNVLRSFTRQEKKKDEL